MESRGAEVKHVNIYKRPDGTSKGCGNVKFATVDDAKRAFDLNGFEWDGRSLLVANKKKNVPK